MIEDLNGQAFYQLRDDRTNRLTENRDYHRLHLRLIAGTSTIQSFSGQIQLLTAANMLARWCRQIEFGFSDAPLAKQLRVYGHNFLYQRIRAETGQADPFGQFIFRKDRSQNVQYTLKIGGDQTTESVDFTIDSNGWDIWAGRGNCSFDLSQPQHNPVGPAFAACVGVADAFKVAVGLPEANRVHNLALCLLDFSHLNTQSPACSPQISTPLTFGNMQVVGVGSVGSAVIYLLAMLPLDGFIRLIDHDIVKIENLNRSPLFGISDVDMAKVVTAANYLQPIVPVEAFNGRYDQFVQQYGHKPGDVDLVLPLANEFGVRTYIEHNFPPLQIYGTTTSDWGINYHRHIPLKEDCSLCRFPADTQQVSFVCSGTQVETERGEQIDAALPFLSMGAAALTVADLLKLHMPGYPFTSNFAFIDFKGKLEFLVVYQKPRRITCMCNGRSTRIHKDFIASTQHSSL